jgi:hypothetical protein
MLVGKRNEALLVAPSFKSSLKLILGWDEDERIEAADTILPRGPQCLALRLSS